ncbi:MAG: hypothetical protein PHF70_00045 [Opitutales bacterium]|nr:hypothetical protein [Opitutales bacterium]
MKDWPFYPSPYPFSDFAYVYSTLEDGHSSLALVDRLKLNGVRLASHGCFLSSEPFDPANKTFSGWAYLPSGDQYSLVYSGQDDSRNAVDPTCTGSFTCADLSAAHPRFFSDCFGMGVIYYYCHKGITIVSNRLHLLVILAHHLDPEAEIDPDCFLALTLDHPYFAQQAFNNRFPLKHLKRLPVNQLLTVIDGFPHIETVDPMLWEQPDPIQEYSRLVSLVARDINQKALAIVARFGIDRLVFDLSGGRDSRLSIAPLLAAGMKPLIHTANPPNLDLAIASVIANCFGLQFVKESPKALIGTGSFPLNLWISYNMGEYNVNALSGRINSCLHKPNRVTGSAGEIYRDFWPHHFGNITLDDPIEHLVLNKCERFKKLSEETRCKVLKFACESGALDSESHLQFMQRGYLEYRNRFHFGLRLFSTMVDASYITPLLSKTYWEANKAIRQAGLDLKQFIGDVTNAICPDLATIPYESDPEAAGFCDAHREIIESKQNEPQSWPFDCFEKPAAKDIPLQDKNDGVVFDRLMDTRVARSLAAIRLLSDKNTGEEICESIFNYLQNWKNFYPQNRKSRQWVRILQSRTIASTAFVPESQLNPNEMASLEAQYLSPIKGVGVSPKDEEVQLHALVHADVIKAEYEYAFYFYAENEIIRRFWYSPENQITISRSEWDPCTKVIVFARLKGFPKRVFNLVIHNPKLQ